jgi:hypothetical protein
VHEGALTAFMLRNWDGVGIGYVISAAFGDVFGTVYCLNSKGIVATYGGLSS